MLADFEPPHGFWLAEFLDTYLAAGSGKLVGPGRIQAAVSEGPEDVQVNHTGTQYRGLTQDPCTEIGVQDGAYCGTRTDDRAGTQDPNRTSRSSHNDGNDPISGTMPAVY